MRSKIVGDFRLLRSPGTENILSGLRNLKQAETFALSRLVHAYYGNTVFSSVVEKVEIPKVKNKVKYLWSIIDPDKIHIMKLYSPLHPERISSPLPFHSLH